MGARFIGGDREQVFLMPPLVTDWVPEDHLVWTVLEAVGELDLSGFYAAYRVDGHGRPAYEPSMTSRCCSTRMRAGTGPRAGSSARAWRTSPTAS
jgi:transposase